MYHNDKTLDELVTELHLLKDAYNSIKELYEKNVIESSKNEEALRESEEQFRQLFEAESDAILLIDNKTGGILKANTAATVLYGYTAPQLLYKKYYELLVDKETAENMAKYLAATHDQLIYVPLTYHRHKNGDQFAVEITGRFIIRQGKSVRLAAIRNIGERIKVEEQLRQSEEKYRLIAENASDVIWVVDANTLKFNYISPSVVHLTGYTVEESLQQTLNQVFAPQSESFVSEILQKSSNDFNEGKNTIKTRVDELQQIGKDGSVIWVEISSTFIVNAEGKVTDILGVSRNIEQRKKDEWQIEQNNHKLQELNATKDKFFSIVANDLKNPFYAIIGFSELLQNNALRYTPEEVQQFASNIQSAANQTYKLLENLLEWSRIQRGMAIPKFHNYNLQLIAADMVAMHSNMAKNKNISVYSHISKETPVFCDVDMLKTVLHNLISNGIKYTDCTGKVSVSAINLESEIEIRVTDTGIGIVSEKIPYLFSIEKNISTLGTSEERGTGLGLILCKELVEKQGGKIWIESKSGAGSTIFFTIKKPQ